MTNLTYDPQPLGNDMRSDNKQGPIRRLLLKGLMVAAGAIFIFFAALWLVLAYGSSQQISAADAEKKCSDIETTVRRDIKQIEGYVVEKSGKTCSTQEDELGSTDYTLNIYYRVTPTAVTSEAQLKSSIDTLTNKLPQRNYRVFVSNLRSVVEHHFSICVSATQYIDNDGTVIPQGADGNFAAYTEPAKAPVSGCDNL